MRKGSLLSAFSRKKRSTKEDLDAAWDQNNQIPEYFPSARGRHTATQQQNYQDRANAPSTRMPKLPGAPNRGRAPASTQQFAEQPTSKRKAEPAAGGWRLPALHAGPPYAQNTIQLQSDWQGMDSLEDQQNTWSDVTSVPHPMPGVWPHLGPTAGSQDFSPQQHADFSVYPTQSMPGEGYTLPSHANPLQDSYARTDAFAGGTYSAWPAYQASQPAADLVTDSHSQDNPRPHRNAGYNDGAGYNDAGNYSAQDERALGPNETLDPWTGLLQRPRQPLGPALRKGPGSGINWGLDQDSMSLAASASASRNHHDSHAASSDRGSQRRSGTSTQRSGATPTIHTSSRMDLGRMDATNDGFVNGTEDLPAMPQGWAETSQQHPSARQRSSSEAYFQEPMMDAGTPADNSVPAIWASEDQSFGSLQPQDARSERQVEAQRVHEGLSWATQKMAAPAGAQSPAQQESRQQQTNIQAVRSSANRGYGNPMTERNGNGDRSGGIQSARGIGSPGGVDASMGGESMFIAATVPRQDSVSLQWNLPRRPQQKLPQQLQPGGQASKRLEHQSSDAGPSQGSISKWDSASQSHLPLAKQALSWFGAEFRHDERFTFRHDIVYHDRLTGLGGSSSTEHAMARLCFVHAHLWSSASWHLS